MLSGNDVSLSFQNEMGMMMMQQQIDWDERMQQVQWEHTNHAYETDEIGARGECRAGTT